MPSRLLSILLPFAAGVAIVTVVAVAYLLLRDSGGGNDDAVPGSPTPVPFEGPYPVLADGQYIDSLPTNIPTVSSGFEAVPLTKGASTSANIAVLEITGIVETIIPTSPPGQITPDDRRGQDIPWTTYSARVMEWIKGGNGETEMKVTIAGGNRSDGPFLITGTFLAQAGRTYLTTLDPKTADVPGSGDYAGALAGWSSFEIGDGAIHVLNENNSRRFMGAYNLTPLDEFIAMVREWIIAPPAVTPTPPPSPTASP